MVAFQLLLTGKGKIKIRTCTLSFFSKHKNWHSDVRSEIPD